ncbi:MAG: alpha-2-macroglobulin family protein [Thermoplasmata archaeon]
MKRVMKLTSAAVVYILMILLLPFSGAESAVPPPPPASPAAHTGLELYISPPLVVAGEPITLKVRCAESPEASVAVALYLQTGGCLSLQTQGSVALRNGTALLENFWQLEQAGRYFVAAIVNIYGERELFPPSITLPLLSTLRDAPSSALLELFAAPRVYATVSQKWEHILGCAQQTYHLRLWSAKPVTLRDPAWAGLEPQQLLGTLYEPAWGVVELYLRRGGGHTVHWKWVAVPLEGTTLTELWQGREEVTVTAVAEGHRVDDGLASSVTTHLYSPDVWELRVPSLATCGELTVGLRKRALCLPQEEFDREMRRLVSFKALLAKHASRLQPATGTANVTAFLRSGPYALAVDRVECAVRGEGDAVLNLSLPGNYSIATCWDRNSWTPSGLFYWDWYSDVFDDVSGVTVAGPWVSLELPRSTFRPRESVVGRLRTGPGEGVRALVLLDGKEVARTTGSGSLCLGTPPNGRHIVAAVLDTSAALAAMKVLSPRGGEGLDWYSSAEFCVGSFTASLSAPDELVQGLGTGARVVVLDPELRPIGGASVDLNLECWRPVSSGYYSRTKILLGRGVTDFFGSFSCGFTCPADAANWGATLTAEVSLNGEAARVSRELSVRRERLAAFISTDKPMYKGGDVVHARFIVWSEDRLSPFRGDAEWEFVSPGDYVIYKDKVTLGELGTADMNITVGREASRGNHMIRLSIGGREVARRTVLVKPYTLPMTRLTLSTPQEPVRTGDVCTVEARVEYTLWKAPVESGVIDYTVSALASLDPRGEVDWGSSEAGAGAQGQAQGQGQGAGEARNQKNGEDSELSAAELEEAYLSSLTELFKWSGSAELARGEARLSFTVPPLATALRLTAVFTDALDHRNEETAVIYIGKRPVLSCEGLEVSTPREAFSVAEPALVSFHTSSPERDFLVRVTAAGEDGGPVEVLCNKLSTGRDGWLNTSLQELGIDVRSLLVEGYHSYVICALYPSDSRVRAVAALTVFRNRYTASSERMVYRAGETVRIALRIQDGLAPDGPAPADEDYIAIFRDGWGTLARLTGRTTRGSALLSLPVPAGTRTALWSVDVCFEKSSLSLQLGVVARDGSLMEAEARELTGGVELEVRNIPEGCGALYIDAWSSSSVQHLTAIVKRGRARALVPRPDSSLPMTLLVYSFGPDGVNHRTMELEVERTPPALTVETDRKEYEPGELVGLTLRSDRPVEVSLAVVSNALYDRNPVLERDWLARAPRIPSCPIRIQFSDIDETFTRDELFSFAEAHCPWRSTCPLPACGGGSQGDGQSGGSGSNGGAGSGTGQGQGQGQGQSAQEGATVSDLLPRDMDLSDELRSDMEGARMRKWFTDAAYWNPAVLVTEAGLSLTVRLPDNVRTWRATALGVTGSCTGAVAVHKFNVKKSFYVEMRVPEELTQDDEVFLTAVVYNFRQEPLRVKVAFHAPGWLQVFGETERWADIGAESVRAVEFPVRVVGCGVQNLTLLATDFGENRDAVFSVVHVRANGVESVTRLSGEITDGLSFTVSRDRWSVKESVNATLSISFSFEDLVIEGMESLIDYPYGCNEQTMSRLMPDVLVRRYLENVGRLTPELETGLMNMILSGIQKLLDTQHGDGGWGWYKQDKTNTYMTAWILFGLSTMKENGFFIDQRVLDAGARCLAGRMNPDGSWTGAHWMSGRDTAMTAFATLALASSGSPESGALERAVWRLRCLWMAGRVVDAYDASLMALALRAAGQPSDEQEEWLVRHILDDHWDGGALGRTAETTGWAVLALLRAGELPTAIEGLKWIARNRSDYGWGTTSATMAVLLALDEASRHPFYAGGGEGSITLLLNGESFATWDSGAGSSSLDLSPFLMSGPLTIGFSVSGAGKGFYSYVQVETIRPPVRVSCPARVTATRGEPLRLLVCASLEDPECGVRIVNLDGSIPPVRGVKLLQKSVDMKRGELAFELWPMSAGTKRICPLIVSYQLEGGSGLSSLIRVYRGPIELVVEELGSEPSEAEVSVEKTASEQELLVGGRVAVNITVRAEGSAVGKLAEVRDLIPPQFRLARERVSGWKEGSAQKTDEEQSIRERIWRVRLERETRLSYELVLEESFTGDLGRAFVIVDGVIAAASGVVEFVSAHSGAFVSRIYDRAEALLNGPVTVRLRCAGPEGGMYYAAIEDTLPPGFEVDRTSVEAALDERVTACEVSGSRVSFLIGYLKEPVEITYRAIPTLPGSFVAPPARLFPMYNESLELFSGSSQVVVRDPARSAEAGNAESAGSPGAGKGGPETEGETAEAVPVRESGIRDRRETAGAGAPVEAPIEEAAELPDLSVDAVRTIGEPVEGREVGFLFVLRFEGLQEFVWLGVRIYLDGVGGGSADVRLRPGDGTICIDHYTILTAGSHSVTVAVDPANHIPESDERNNTLTVTVHVAPALAGSQGDEGGALWEWRTVLSGAAAIGAVAVAGVFLAAGRRAVRRRARGGAGRQS